MQYYFSKSQSCPSRNLPRKSTTLFVPIWIKFHSKSRISRSLGFGSQVETRHPTEQLTQKCHNKVLIVKNQGYQIIRKSIRNSSNYGYTDSKGTVNARKAVAKITRTKITINQNDAIINHGVNTGLMSALMAFTNQGDQILIPQIGYPFFQDLCPAMNRKAVCYKLKGQKNFYIDLEHAKTLVNEKTQFIFVINPSNSMGTAFTKSHMQEILKFSDQNELPIVSDEVYYGQSSPDTPFYSFGELIEDVPVVLLSGMEKNFQVPGWSVSWSVIIDKNEYIKQVKQKISVLSTIFLHPNKFVQQGFPELFDKVGLFINREMGHIQKVHDEIYERLRKKKGLKTFKAQGTIYITVEIDLSVLKDIKSDQQFVHKMLQNSKISMHFLQLLLVETFTDQDRSHGPLLNYMSSSIRDLKASQIPITNEVIY